MRTEIQDPDDPRLGFYVGLTDAALRRHIETEHGVFVVEGARTVRQLLDSRWPVLSVLLRPDREAPLADVVAVSEQRDVPVYVAAPVVFDRIAGFPVHRGVLAVAARLPEADPITILDGVGTAVVVEGVNDHENLGAIFRNAAALGAGAVLLDPTCCDPLYRRCIRVSVGHALRLPFARLRPWPQALADLRTAGFVVVALDLAATDPVESVPPGGRLAVMVGSEGDGLTAAARAAAGHRVRLPMARGVDLLNVATALAIALYALIPRR
jgi:tRNA G18 (ribose-2'-O)-methylase SpoU